jgi:hypothetical protein
VALAVDQINDAHDVTRDAIADLFEFRPCQTRDLLDFHASMSRTWLDDS